MGNLRKPRYWAIRLAAELGPDRLGVEVTGDGAGSLVEAIAARRDDGTIDVLMWNVTLDQSKAEGSDLLARTVRLRIDGLAGSGHEATLARVDADHSDISARWQPSDGAAWPSPEEWAELRAADRLWEEPLGQLTPDSGGRLDVTVPLPMPGVARLRLTPIA